jgi:ATP-dependent DNA helicase PIF1
MTDLTPSQETAAEAVDTGDNVLITGPAGTGKSFLIDYLTKRHALALTATTGIAAANIGGVTVNSWAGIGIGQGEVDYVCSRLARGSRERIVDARALVVDEVSMLTLPLTDLLDGVFKKVRGSDEPFGGLQMIFVGDFLQLPPVEPDRKKPRFAFESVAWQSANVRTCQLTEIVRQSDKDFAELLNAVRVADLDYDLSALTDRLGKGPGDEPCTRLFTHNVNVDAFNADELVKIDQPLVSFDADDGGHPDLVKSCRLPDKLVLKEGALVMSLVNAGTLRNGSQGVVSGFNAETGLPVVDFGGEVGEIEMGRITREITRGFERAAVTEVGGELPWIDDQGNRYASSLVCQGHVTRPRVVASRKQIPLRLAWAITVHKSQGMTLDRVEADLSKVFMPGMVYTALSRVRSLDGLFLKGIKNIEASDKALQFYNQTKK